MARFCLVLLVGHFLQVRVSVPDVDLAYALANVELEQQIEKPVLNLETKNAARFTNVALRNTVETAKCYWNQNDFKLSQCGCCSWLFNG